MNKTEKMMNVDFESLVKNIQHASEALQQDARLIINRNVTTRAWLTGFYIVELSSMVAIGQSMATNC